MTVCERPRAVCTSCPACSEARCPGSNRRLPAVLLSPFGDARCDDCGREVGTYGIPHDVRRRVAWHRLPTIKGEQQ